MAASASSGVSGATTSAPAPVASAPAAAPAASPSSVRQSIFEAVDGAGVEPGLADWKDPATTEEKPKKAPKAKVAPAALQVAPALDTSVEDTVDPDVLKYFEQELNPQTVNPDGDVEVEGEEQLSDRAQNRFQVLANRAKAAEVAAQQAIQNHQQMQGYVGQLTEMMQQQKVENARLQTAVQMLAQRQQMPQQQQELDPATEFQNRLRDDTLKQLNPQLQKLIAPMQQELKQLRAEKVQEQRTNESNVNKQRYLHESDNAARNIALAGFSTEDMTPELLSETQEDIMAVAWGHRTSMEEAAKIVRNRTMRRALAFVRAQSKSNRAKMQDRQNAPAGLPGAQGGARGDSEPTWKQIKESGAKDALDFMMKRDGLTR